MAGTPSEKFGETVKDTYQNGSEHSSQDSVILKGSSKTYKLIEKVGQGSYGYVYKGRVLGSGRLVAVKIFRYPNCEEWAKREFDNCLLFTGLNPFVEILDIFTYKQLSCLVFEFLQQNLLKYIMMNGAMPIQQVRALIRQLLDGLRFMQEKNFIHGDLKPANIMIVEKESRELHLKIIDMGSAMPITEDMNVENVQTLHFRAPEVLLQAPCSGKVDLWSLGCILAEMLLGRRLYPGETPRDQIIMITKVQGELPESVLSKGRKVMFYYDYSDTSEYKLKASGYIDMPKSFVPSGLYYTFNMNSLDDVVDVDETASYIEKQLLTSLLKFMLNTDSEQRCSAEEALKHQFLTA